MSLRVTSRFSSWTSSRLRIRRRRPPRDEEGWSCSSYRRPSTRRMTTKRRPPRSSTTSWTARRAGAGRGRAGRAGGWSRSWPRRAPPGSTSQPVRRAHRQRAAGEQFGTRGAPPAAGLPSRPRPDDRGPSWVLPGVAARGATLLDPSSRYRLAMTHITRRRHLAAPLRRKPRNDWNPARPGRVPTSSGGALVEFRDLTVSYGPLVALSGVTGEFPPGPTGLLAPTAPARPPS
jgi:hypothetical protein